MLNYDIYINDFKDKTLRVADYHSGNTIVTLRANEIVKLAGSQWNAWILT